MESEKISRMEPYLRQPRPDIRGQDNRYVFSSDLLHELQYCKPDPKLLRLNTRIAGIRLAAHGLTPRPEEGIIAHLLLPAIECKGTARSGGFRLSNNNVQEVQDALSRIPISQHKPLISLFRHAIGADEPVVQFLILYLILYDRYGNQHEVDRQVMLHEPATPRSISPHDGRQETIYTRLRNEIIHRTNAPDTTRAEIIDNLDGFRIIVHRILKLMS